jgi:hypothetical protein
MINLIKINYKIIIVMNIVYKSFNVNKKSFMKYFQYITWINYFIIYHD